MVDSVTALLPLLDNIISLPVDPHSLYLNLEEIKLCRYGSISIISFYVPPTKKIYIIDIHRLSRTAFSTTNSNAASLQTILESPTISKVNFDIRNDSDALFSLYQIFADGVKVL
jgi:exonuclease 3'-5' domain-containing protein 1